MTHRASIILGSNHAAEVNLPRAVAALRQRCDVIAVSPVYESPATQGGESIYLNAAVCIETDLSPLACKQDVLGAVERALGRVRGPGAPVAIDLDLALWDDAAFTYGDKPWRVPHPDILCHAHAARPLADLAPDFVHPEDGRTLSEIAASLPSDHLTRRDDVVLAPHPPTPSPARQEGE